ncbi:MAG: thiamine-binding protein [Prochlorococcaceae cyanobacterium]
MPPAARRAPAQLAALQLHVTLNDIEPRIWRRFWVEDTITLGRLHEVLQIVMGWLNYHFHQFITGERSDEQIFYTPPWDDGFGDPEFIARQRDELRVKARTILPLVKDSVIYEYDLGDSWQHTLLLEKVLLDTGLKIQLHPNGTAIEACHQAVHAMGCPRIYTTVKFNTRINRDQMLEDKVASLEALLQQLPERCQ